MVIVKAKNNQDMSRKAANIISAQLILQPDSVLGLATGSTPVGTYRQLIEWYEKGDLDFSRARTVNLDECCGLSSEDPHSYHFFMQEHFFRHINLPADHIRLPNGAEPDEQAACGSYDRMIADLGGIDLQLLGLGQNGHIGFNEPSTSFSKGTHRVRLSESTLLANARFFEKPEDVPRYAYSMGVQTIMLARRILLIASGPSKAEAIQKACFGPVTPAVPASILQLHPNVNVIVIADAQALSLCPETAL